MGRGGFPPSETGSFSAHHTAARVGFCNSDLWYQLSGKPSIVFVPDLRAEG
jgi:hypothetical protein